MGARRQGRTAARRVQTRLRESKALQLRLEGHAYAVIGEKLGITAQAAQKQVSRLLDELAIETRKDTRALRKLELARLDAMTKALWPKVKKGDPRAIDRALKIMIRRSNFVGLDAPKRREFTGAGGEPLIPPAPTDLSKLTPEQLQKLDELLTAAEAPTDS